MSTQILWDIDELRQFQELVGQLNAGGNLQGILQQVVDGVVEIAGFEVAAVNHLQADGMLECIAVAGNDAARAQLLGDRQPQCAFEAEFAVAERWGSLCFVPHDRMPTEALHSWIPDLVPADDPDAWHPNDALFAPLHSQGGDLIGVLSVDLPFDRRRPGPFQREILQMYATQAGIAIYRAQLTDHLIESEQAFRLTFENAGIGMAVLSLEPGESSRYLRANPAFCELVGYTEEKLKTLSTADITHPDDRDTDVANIHKSMTTTQRVFEVEKRYQHADGGLVWVAVTTSILEDANGRPVSAISQVQDIGRRRALQDALTRDALHDSLTGLPNRRALYEHLHHSQSHIEGIGQTYVLFCDLDGFKSVNDRLGHAVGDCALTALGQRLCDAVGPADVVARLGGDEFVVVALTTDAAALADNLTKSVATPFIVNGTSVSLTLSIGIAAVAQDTDPAQAIHSADWAMYEVKRSGGNDYLLAHKLDR